MKKITLTNTDATGQKLSATFAPSHGMNLISYRAGELEVIDQATLPFFKERYAGLGPLIGPHFHRRETFPEGFDTSLFPHIEKVRKKGTKEPFSHGIARYVPWKFVSSGTQIQAKLKGSDLYKGVPLSTFEGMDFTMTFDARLLSSGLHIVYAIRSSEPSIIGLHTYYAISGKSSVHGEVKETYRSGKEWHPLPKEWTGGKPHHLQFDLENEADYGFIPLKRAENQHFYRMILDTEQYSLHLDYNTISEEEISCQIYHPKGETFACVEPLSARYPNLPVLDQNKLEINIQILV